MKTDVTPTLRDLANAILDRPWADPDDDLSKMARAALAASTEVPGQDVERHPGESHAFATTCRKCGEPGFLHVSLITPDERVSIESADPEPAEPRP
jgi:hypothetical protein